MLAERPGISREYLYRTLDNPTDAFIAKLADALGAPRALQQAGPSGPHGMCAIELLPLDRWRLLERIGGFVP